jgi:valyl-tRNA synthetase
MSIVMDAVLGIRSIRGELNLPPSLELNAVIKAIDGNEDILKENISYIARLAKTGRVEIGSDMVKPADAAVSIRPSMEIYVPLKGLFDVRSEIKRLTKEINKIEVSLSAIERKLSNDDFIKKAPKAVVETNRLKCREYKEKLTASKKTIEMLKNMGGQ